MFFRKTNIRQKKVLRNVVKMCSAARKHGQIGCARTNTTYRGRIEVQSFYLIDNIYIEFPFN